MTVIDLTVDAAPVLVEISPAPAPVVEITPPPSTTVEVLAAPAPVVEVDAQTITVEVSAVGSQGTKGDKGDPGMEQIYERETPFTNADAANLPSLYIRRNPVTGRVYRGTVT